MRASEIAGSWLRQMTDRVGRARRDRVPPTWTRTQRLFVEWNAERLGISVADSESRYRRSWAALPGGHKGREFRELNSLCYELGQVFSQDCSGEVFDAYLMHAPMHFLRMLSYADPSFSDDHPVVRALEGAPEVTVLDFGCGLAQQSRALCAHLLKRRRRVALVLADIPTLRREFLLWAGERSAIPTRFLDCTPAQPIPTLPTVQLCIATDFFEHVHDPLQYFDRIDHALVPGGLLIADTQDHQAEFMHVSPKLDALRARLRERGYVTLRANAMFRKPGDLASSAGQRHTTAPSARYRPLPAEN